MSDLKSLYVVTRVIETWQQNEASVETLLENLLPPIQSVIAGTIALRLYRTLPSSMQLIATAGHPVDIPLAHDIPPDNTPVYQDQSWGVPIKSFGLLEICLSTVASPHEAQQHWLELFSFHLHHIFLLENGIASHETQLLYEIHRELLHANEPLDMLWAIKDKIAQEAAAIVFYTVQWDDSQDEIIAIEHTAIIDKDGDREPKQNILEGMTPEQVQIQLKSWKKQKENVEFFENFEEDIEAYPALHIAYTHGIHSSIIIPVFHKGKLSQQISIGYSTPQQYDDTIRRLYSAIGNHVALVLQNHYVSHNTQETAEDLGDQLHILQTMRQLSGKIATAHDEKELTDWVCKALVDVLNIRHTRVVLHDPLLGRPVLMSEHPDMAYVETELDLDSPLQIELREEFKSVVVEDVDTDDRLLQGQRERLKDLKIQSLLLMPLLDEEKHFIGSIELGRFADDPPFDDRILGIVSTMGNQITISLQNIRLMESSHQQAKRMENIANFSQAIQHSLKIEQILDVVFLNIPKIIPVDDIAIMLVDDQTNALRMAAWYDTNGNKHVKPHKGELVVLEDTTTGRAWQKRESLHIRDINQEENLRYTHKDDIRSVLVMPIYSRGGVIGLVEVGSTNAGHFSSIDHTIFQQLVSQLSTSIENAESYAESLQFVVNKALVNAISSELQQQLDMESLIEVTISKLGSALGAKKARIHLMMHESEYTL